MRLSHVCFAALTFALATVQALASDLPDPARTPGAVDSGITQDNIQSTICVKGYTKTIRPPANFTNRLKKHQLREYSYSDRNPKHYEEDHLIPLEIGGNPTSPLNLWPEPRGGKWSAKQKDKLENKLHRLVCKNKIRLEQAQEAIASNWIEAYRTYVGK